MLTTENLPEYQVNLVSVLDYEKQNEKCSIFLLMEYTISVNIMVQTLICSFDYAKEDNNSPPLLFLIAIYSLFEFCIFSFLKL